MKRILLSNSSFISYVRTLGEARLNKVEELKKRVNKRPDWNDLMKEISVFRDGHSRLKRVHCNDRSNPMLPSVKAGKSVSSNRMHMLCKGSSIM